MKTNCPNKSHPDFKKLVEEFGELDATYAYFLNDEDIPSVDVAGKLLGKSDKNFSVSDTQSLRFKNDNDDSYSERIPLDNIMNYASSESSIKKSGLLRFMNENSKVEYYRSIANSMLNRISDIAADNDLEITSTDNYYDPITDKIALSDVNHTETFLHEFTHNLTAPVITRYMTLNDKSKLGLNESQIKFCEDILKLYYKAIDLSNSKKSGLNYYTYKGEFEKVVGHDGEYYYGLSDVTEFISEAFTNPTFQKYLLNLETNSEGSVFSNLLKILYEFLNKTFNGKSNLLNDTVNIIEDFIKNTDVSLGEKEVHFRKTKEVVTIIKKNSVKELPYLKDKLKELIELKEKNIAIVNKEIEEHVEKRPTPYSITYEESYSKPLREKLNAIKSPFNQEDLVERDRIISLLNKSHIKALEKELGMGKLYEEISELERKIEEIEHLFKEFDSLNINKINSSQSFSSPRLTPLQSLLTELNSKAGITLTPANNFIVDGLINEQYILNNEVSIAELAPLFYDTIVSLKANKDKLMSMVDEGFGKMSYSEKMDYLANTSSSSLKEFLTNEAIKILNAQGKNVSEKTILYDIIGKHNDIKYVQRSKNRNTASVKPIQGSLDKSKQTAAQQKISTNFEKTDDIYDNDNPYIEINVADFIKAGGNPIVAKGAKTITRYRLKTPINGREFAIKRTSDLQKELVNKWKTEQEIEFQEKYYEITRVTGTSLHTVMEDVIKNHLVKYDDPIFKNMIDKVSKGGNFTKKDLESLQKNIYNQLIVESSFQKERKEYLDSPENPFKENKKSPYASYNKLVESIIGDYISILKIQVLKDWKINKDLSADKQIWNRVNVYTERRIYEDGKQDGGGTMDLVAVYSDGDYGILDYKFITAQTKKGDKTKGEEAYVLNVDELQKSYMQNRERSYDTQLSSYSEVMTKVYGAKNLVFARIKPTYLQYTTNDKGKIDNNSKVSSVFTSEEAFGLIPISKERTGNKNLDAFLDRLVNQTKAIAKNLTDRKAWTTDFITLNRLTELKKITMSIQKEGDISLYTKYATMFLETMNERMENRIDSFDRTAVIEATNELDFIRYFLKNTTGIMEEYTKNFPELVDNFKADIGIILTKVNDIDSKLSEIRILRMREEANSVGIDDVTFDSYENAKDISGIQQMMLGMKSVNHVFHQTFARRVELMNTERIIFQRKIQDELSIKLEELNEWGKRKGLSGSDVFTPLLNDRKDMITPWNEDFLKDMELRKDMSNYENVKWFEENFHRSKVSVNGRPSDEDRFQRAKKNLFDKLEAAYGNQDSAKDRINNIKKEWLRKNDITHPEFIGWSYTQYKSPKNPEKYYNDKYREMMKPENKALRDFYEYSIKMNYIFRDMMGDAVDLKYNFVANVHKTMLDTLSQDGVSMTGVFSKYWNSLMNSTMNDPNDKMGDGKKEIPILFVDYVPVGDKSVDLGKSLMLFATFVNNYKHAVDLAEVYNMARRILIETPLAATDSKGNKVKSIRQVGKFEPAQALAGTESNLTKALDNYANVYAFGEDTKQDAISEFLGEKGVKRLAAVRKYVSRSSMSFNILSAAVGSLNTNLQMHSFAANGKYFTAKQVFAAEKAVASFNAKLAFAEIFFETDPQLSETNVKAGTMSANALVKKFSNDPVYVFQRWFDKIDEKVILHCMMNNYGINPETGQVERIDKLKEKYENDPAFANFEWKSIWDSMEEYTNAAGEKEMRIVNQHTGKNIEPNFSEKLTGDALLDNNKNINTFMSMRRVTMNVSSRVKGTQSSEDTASWKHTVLGQVFGQFRSWMIPTVNERLKKEQYNMSMDEFEVGRWTAIYNMAGNNLLNSCKLLGKSLIPFVNQDFSSDMNVKMQEMYDLFVENNPDFAGKVSFKDYLNEYKGQMRSLSREIKIFAAILLLHAALLPLLFPGDDEDDKGMIFNTISTTLGRLTTELGFYLPFTPQGATEFKKLISKDPMPLVRAMDDVGNIVKNTYDETRDLIFGEDSRRDKTPPLYYAANVFGMKNAFRYLGITDTDDKTNSIWEWLTDDSEHGRK